MAIIHYICEDCKKEVGFRIEDDLVGIHKVKVKGKCCNVWVDEK